MQYLSLDVLPQASPVLLQQLQVRFFRLAKAHRLPTTTAEPYWKELQEQYEQPQRHYHNLVHLNNMLTLLDAYATNGKEVTALEFAIWYHDLIYDIMRKDNEIQSANRFKQLWAPYVPEEVLRRVEIYIVATEGHQPRSTYEEERLFLDWDLAILAAEPPVYQKYSAAIAQEYSSLYSPAVYKMGRRYVLEHFMEREELFLTPYYQQHYRLAAQANLQQEWNQLERCSS